MFGLSNIETWIYTNYSRNPFIQINWDGKQSGYPENPDNWIFLWK